MRFQSLPVRQDMIKFDIQSARVSKLHAVLTHIRTQPLLQVHLDLAANVASVQGRQRSLHRDVSYGHLGHATPDCCSTSSVLLREHEYPPLWPIVSGVTVGSSIAQSWQLNFRATSADGSLLLEERCFQDVQACGAPYAASTCTHVICKPRTCIRSC